ncbi:hypothetical protein GCM10022224_018400 [Nonomuraea antimicrobica]|uniref:Uncharacterized protein n=1 Tax=Nonomuraea antimicrobica TaxID=561173 RepID=A0ABP7BD96_9ACTN
MAAEDLFEVELVFQGEQGGVVEQVGEGEGGLHVPQTMGFGRVFPRLRKNPKGGPAAPPPRRGECPYW